ncbi:MAG: NADH-quinone oxidoreductase subunit, partial [Thermoleophilaceae bacterium]|nr:NADH-quinone oxidoreductase subunit [Thermoleophilaceae bacterium]
MTHTLAVNIPHIDYKGLSPLIAVAGGSMVVLMVGLFRGHFVHRVLSPLLAIASLGAAIGLSIWIWEPGQHKAIVAGALSVDTLALGLSILFYISGIVAVILAMNGRTVRSIGGADMSALLLGSIAGMVVLAEAQNLIVLFVGFELLSIPL